MKRIITTCISIALCFSMAAQNRDSASSKDYFERLSKKGIYRTHQEFLSDDPSINDSFCINTRSKGVQLYTFAAPNALMIYNDRLGRFTVIDKKCWGFYDGQGLYILEGKKCLGVKYLGRFSKYSLRYWGWETVRFGNQSVSTPKEYHLERIIDFETNKRYLYTVFTFKRILRIYYPELLRKFKTERKKIDKIDMYLFKLNGRLTGNNKTSFSQ